MNGQQLVEELAPVYGRGLVRFGPGGSLFPLPKEVKGGRGAWVVVDPIPVSIRLLGFSIDFEIHAGFETDLTSRPWFTAWLCEASGRHGLASILHDFALKHLPELPKRQCDALYLLALYALDVPDARAVLMFGGVRLAKDNDRGEPVAAGPWEREAL